MATGDAVVGATVQRFYGPSREERMEEIRAHVQALINDPNWYTADGYRVMVPKWLLVKLLANDPDARV